MLIRQTPHHTQIRQQPQRKHTRGTIKITRNDNIGTGHTRASRGNSRHFEGDKRRQRTRLPKSGDSITTSGSCHSNEPSVTRATSDNATSSIREATRAFSTSMRVLRDTAQLCTVAATVSTSAEKQNHGTSSGSSSGRAQIIGSNSGTRRRNECKIGSSSGSSSQRAKLAATAATRRNECKIGSNSGSSSQRVQNRQQQRQLVATSAKSAATAATRRNECKIGSNSGNSSQRVQNRQQQRQLVATSAKSAATAATRRNECKITKHTRATKENAGKRVQNRQLNAPRGESVTHSGGGDSLNYTE
jgi:hypothetical protein